MANKYVVRVIVMEVMQDGDDWVDENVILSKDINDPYINIGDAITFAQKVWRKFFTL